MCGRLSHLAFRVMFGPQISQNPPSAGLAAGMSVRIRAGAAILRGLQPALMAI